MQTGYTGHITPLEWRWVTVISSALVLLALLPFLSVVLSGRSEQFQFMGTLHNFPETSIDLAKVVQGAQGRWLTQFPHTPEPHNAVLLDVIYSLLGQVSRFTLIPPIILFHVARVIASIYMYAALYSLGAMIWTRLRTRRIFFGLVVIGSGLGWLYAPLTQNWGSADLLYPQIYPFFSSLINVHYPLAIGILALMASAMIQALRPGSEEEPGVNNSGIVLFFSSLMLALIYPEALFPIAVAFYLIVIGRSFKRRKFTQRTLRWMLWFGVPALPIIAYYISIFIYNPVVRDLWLQSHPLNTPSPLLLLIGLGLPLLIALPGIVRALRRFEAFGDQFMLVWLGVIVVLIYLFPVVRIDFAIGLMILIAYFGARGAEDFWFARLARPWRYRIAIGLIPVLAISLFYVLFMPNVAINTEITKGGPLLAPDYVATFQWLETRPDYQVVLAAPATSVWIPVWTGMRVVYAHGNGTLDAVTKFSAVEAWYRATDPSQCEALLEGQYHQHTDYRVLYVIYGPIERTIGETVCLDALAPIVSFGEVEVYRYLER
ncbi:MAG: hypothetical protein MUF87_17300 [Anaerolineae bacterium]|jgi:hypothetical protein|nr:hypothetical protein [Anaerolineae bacterium]